MKPRKPGARRSAQLNGHARMRAAATVALEGLENRVLLAASLATQGLGTLSSSPRQVVNMGGFSFFTISSPTNQLWRTDGTAGGTSLVRDFGTVASDAPQQLRAAGVLNNKLYFAAGAGNGTELWVSDGTAGGTMQLMDIAPLSASSSPTSFTVIGNTVYFVANDPTNGIELWKTDGSAAGTAMVKDIYAVPSASSAPSWLTNLGGTLFFSARDGINGWELWKSDGTPGGTVMVSDINPGSGSSQLSSLVNFGGKLYFNATDPVHGSELWQSDGTLEGTMPVADLNPGAASASPQSTLVSGGRLYFSAVDEAAGRELFVSDGTLAGTRLAVNINPGTASSSPTSIVDLNGRLMFLADGGSGTRLWTFDGTTATELPASPSGSLTVMGSRVYFTGTDALSGAELWSSDGTASGTARVTDLTPGPDSSNTLVLGSAAGSLYFAGENGLLGQELYTLTSTGVVALVKDLNTAPNPSTPQNPVSFNGAVYFGGSSGGLYRSDGTPAGLSRISSQTAARLLVVGNKLFFTGGDASQYPSLWQTDGTPTGTQLVKSYVLPTNYKGSINVMWAWNNRLYYIQPGDSGLWVSDGTPAGTLAVQSPSAPARTTAAVAFTPVGDKAYFYGFDSAHGLEPWRTDGTDAGTIMVRDIHAGGYGSTLYGTQSNQTDIEDLNGVAIFPASTNTNNSELYRSNAAETTMITDLNWSDDASLRLDPVDAADTLVRLGDHVYFFALSWLYRTDGTALGTTPVAPFDSLDTLFRLTRVGNRLFFVVRPKNSVSEYHLYTSDGTFDGTVLLRRFITDGASSSKGIGDIVDIDGIAYFQAWNLSDGTGYELWRSDGTVARTQLAADLNPGSAASNPSNPILHNGELYVVATHASTGTNLWKIPLAVIPPAPTGLSASASSPVHVELSWTLDSSEHSGFVLERSKSAIFATIEDTIPLPPEARSYTDPVAGANTLYYYRLRAYSPAGESTWVTTTLTTPPISWPLGTVLIDQNTTYPSVRALLGFRNQVYASVGMGIPNSNLLRLVRSDDVTLASVTTGFFAPTVLGDWLIFFRDKSLWKSDGTEANSIKIADLTQPSYSGFVFQGLFYFLNGPSLWQCDGTAAGTRATGTIYDQRLQVLYTALADKNALENDHAFLGSMLYYTAAAASGGNQIFRTDGVTTTQVTNVQLVDRLNFGYAYPRKLAAANGSIYFFAQQANALPNSSTEQNIALWRTDGTPDGTEQVRKLDRDQNYGNIVSANGTIYFTTMTTLWASDGTDAGTFLLKSLPAYSFTTITDLAPLGGRLYFVTHTYLGSDGEGQAMWERRLSVSDGTLAGTLPVPGTPDPPSILTPVGDALYFAGGIQNTLYRFQPAAVAQPPAAPSNLTATVFSTAQIDLAWTDNARNEEGFTIERSRSATFASIEATFTVLPNIVHFADTALEPLTTYYYRIRAFNTGGATVYVTAPPATTTSGPAAPVNLTLTNTQPGEKVTLQWSDLANNETSYVVQRSARFDFLPSSAIELSVALPANTTSYIDTTVDPLTKYYYRVFAVNAQGNSAAAKATITTPESRPPAPTQLRVFAVSSTQIDLQWQDNAWNENTLNGYAIERAASNGVFALIAQLPANSTTHADAGLQPGMQYTYRVRAVNAMGSSDDAVSLPTRTLAPNLTTRVKQISQLAGAHPDKFTVIDGTVYFVSSTVTSPNLSDFSGFELWKTGGNSGNTVKLFTGPVNDLVAFKGALYFISRTKVWKSDGTVSGTVQVTDLAASGMTYVSLVGASGSTLFLLASNGVQASIWKSDGTASSFTTVGIVPNGSNTFRVSGSWLYFLDGNNYGRYNGGDLWRTDGSAAPVQIGGITAVEQIIDVNGTLYAIGKPAPTIHVIDLFSIAPGAASATIVKQLLDFDTYPTGINTVTRVGNGLYFSAPDGGNGQVLWKSDGTAAGTVPVFDPVENTLLGKYGLTWAIADVAGTVYFISTDLYNAQPGPTGWLWRTDGTTAGTVRIRAVNVPEVSPYGARPLFLTGVDGKAVYCDGDYLWRSDGTLEGTVQIDRIATASDGVRSAAWFSGAPFAVVGDEFYFGAAVPGGSQELRVAYLKAPGNPSDLTISPVPSPSAPVGDPAPADVPPSGVVLSWTDHSGNESAFAVDRSSRSDFATIDQTFFTAPDVTSVVDPDASPGSNWFYRVRAVNAGGDSAYSNSVAAGAPTVVSTTFDAAQNRLAVRFSDDVSASLGAADAVLTRLGAAQVIPTSAIYLVYDRPGNVATFSFPGLAAGKLPAGDYRLVLQSAAINSTLGLALDGNADGAAGGDYSFDFQVQSTGGYAGTPFTGAAVIIAPDVATTLQAEDFDAGGEDISWHDTDAANTGGNAYRVTAVDLGSTSDGGASGVMVNSTKAGEWLSYSIKILAPGDYAIGLRAASLGIGGTLHLEVDGVRMGSTLTVPDTGAWTNWQTLTFGSVTLTGGVHALRIVCDTAGSLGYVGDFNYLTVNPVRPVLPGDANRDGAVNFFDLTALAASYGMNYSAWADGDFNGDWAINFFDLTILAASYGAPAPAPAAPVASAMLTDSISTSPVTEAPIRVTDTSDPVACATVGTVSQSPAPAAQAAVADPTIPAHSPVASPRPTSIPVAPVPASTKRAVKKRDSKSVFAVSPPIKPAPRPSLARKRHLR